jgi:hypothetical protein
MATVTAENFIVFVLIIILLIIIIPLLYEMESVVCVLFSVVEQKECSLIFCSSSFLRVGIACMRHAWLRWAVAGRGGVAWMGAAKSARRSEATSSVHKYVEIAKTKIRLEY